MPELIQDDFTPAAVAAQVRRLLESIAAREEMKAGLAEVRTRLGSGGAIERAADIFRSICSRISRLGNFGGLSGILRLAESNRPIRERGSTSCSRVIDCSPFWHSPFWPLLRHRRRLRAFPFRATNYDVEVVLHPEDQTIQAQAKVEFVASEVAKTQLVELHPDLQVSSVKIAGGQSLNFGREGNSPLLRTVALPTTVTPGKQVTLTFDYSGPVSSEEDSPTRGVRFASVDKTSAYLLLPARWFPLTNYPSNRYTATFNVIVPKTFAVAGTGKADPPSVHPGIGVGAARPGVVRVPLRRPAPVGSFVAGNLQLSPVAAEGYSISVYTPPAQAATAASYGNSLAQIMSYYSDTFGAFTNQPSLTVVQMPDGSLDGYSAPGLLAISARQWTSRPNDRLLSQLAAGQWWGYQVLPATASDVWVTDGLSRYAEAMYAEESGGVAALNKALEDFAVGALMFEDATPIARGADHLGAVFR